MTNRKTHYERVDIVLQVAIRESIEGHKIASGPLIRKRVEHCLASALAVCQDDAVEMYERIDKVRDDD